MINDTWDEALDVESNAYKQGAQDGIADAKIEGVFEQGVEAGRMKGLAIGLEIGFYEALANKLLSSPTTKIRQAKHIQSIVEKCDNLPSYNDSAIDFEGQVRELRSLYKASGESYGPFQPVNSNKSQEW